MSKFRVGIVGYGNLARGVECAVKQSGDMELCAIFTRRDPGALNPLTPGVSVLPADDIKSMAGKLDVLLLCGGSATDLPRQTPAYARLFNVVDSFDNHGEIPAHFAAVDAAARQGGKVAVISVGWDPGLFSLNRALAGAVLPQGEHYTFWGRGVSQGHSDAVRRLAGVRDARQYTVPVQSALDAVRTGSNPQLTTRQKHTRQCFVVAEEGADRAAIEREIVTMPGYFADYDTTVHFITAEEMARDHSGLPHGGLVIRSGKTGWNGADSAIVEYQLTLDSNPAFTASVLVAYARAACRMHGRGEQGCKTILDIPVADISPMTPEEMRKNLL